MANAIGPPCGPKPSGGGPSFGAKPSGGGPREGRAWVFGLSLAAMGGALHIGTNLPVGEIPVRVVASDLVLPVALGAVLLAALRLRAPTPRWRLGALPLWLLALSLWLGVALVLGRIETAAWHGWAVVNKGLGWLVLLAYLWLGGWITTLGGHRAQERLVRAFIGLGWLACLYAIGLHLSIMAGIVEMPAYARFLESDTVADPFDLTAGVVYGAARLSGLAANPNAFGLLLAALVAVQAPYLKRGLLFPGWLHVLGMGLALACIFLSGSRSALLAVAAGWGALWALKHADWKRSALAALFGFALVLGVGVAGQAIDDSRDGTAESSAGSATSNAPTLVARALIIPGQNLDNRFGLRARLEQVEGALALWRESPIVGAGLGTYLARQADTPAPQQVHTTALWLLAETGAVGLALFAAFFVAAAMALGGRRAGVEREPIVAGTLGLLIGLAAASIGTEVLYQRYLWFFLGLALALPRPEPAGS
ncbi:MAG: O-antigen ligase family protein [Alphaproteobacteria bacterium]